MDLSQSLVLPTTSISVVTPPSPLPLNNLVVASDVWGIHQYFSIQEISSLSVYSYTSFWFILIPPPLYYSTPPPPHPGYGRAYYGNIVLSPYHFLPLIPPIGQIWSFDGNFSCWVGWCGLYITIYFYPPPLLLPPPPSLVFCIVTSLRLFRGNLLWHHFYHRIIITPKPNHLFTVISFTSINACSDFSYD